MAAAKQSTPKTIEEILAGAKGSDLRLGTLAEFMASSQCDAVSTGNMAIDYLTGVGGLPLGRIVELYGPPSCGKTTTALQTAAEWQQSVIAEGRDEYLAYFDYEHALDFEYCAALGLDLDHKSFIIAQPDSLEQGAEKMRELVNTGKLRMMIVDSVAAMVPTALFEGSITDERPGLQAKMIGRLLKPLNSELHANNCLAIFLNHELEAIDIGVFNPTGKKRTYTPGGKALKYFASVRISYNQIGSERSTERDALTQEQSGMVSATKVKVKITKNKVGPPFREATVRVRFGKGFDNFWTALEVLKGHKLIVLTTGGMHNFEKLPALVTEDMGTSPTGRRFLRGANAVLEYADENQQWRELVIDAAIQAVEDGLGGDVETPQDLTDGSDFSTMLE